MDVRYHVVPRAETWSVERTAARRASATCRTKGEAVQKAKQFARRRGVPVLVHDRDGMVEREIM